MNYEEKRILRRGEKRGVKQGQDALVNAIHELKSGKTPDDLSREGIDKATIQRALSCL